MMRLPTVCDMPVMLNAPVLVNEMLPLVVLFVALKLLMALALLKVVPVLELVVSVVVARVLAPVSCSAPAVAVNVTLPLMALKLPVLNKTLRPAVRLMLFDVPEVVMLLATVISLVAPVLVALRLFNAALPPIVPKLNAPAPELSERLKLPAALLLVVPMVSAPPADARLVFAMTVTVPKVNVSLEVLIVPATFVVLAVLVNPPSNVKLSVLPSPNVTPAVFRKVTAFVIVLLAPVMMT